MIIESFRIKRQSRKLPKPFSGNHQLQRKSPGTKCAHTLIHTDPHTPKHVDTEAAETQTQNIKTVRLAHPQ